MFSAIDFVFVNFYRYTHISNALYIRMLFPFFYAVVCDVCLIKVSVSFLKLPKWKRDGCDVKITRIPRNDRACINERHERSSTRIRSN